VLNAIQQYNGSSTNQTLTTPIANTLTSGSGSTLQLQSNGGTTAVTIDTNQNVGIGTSLPTNKLTLNSGYVQVGNGVGGAGGVHFPYSSDALGRTWRARTDITGYGDFGIEQSTTQTGTTYATKFLISQSGYMTIPNQPAFFAKKTNGTGATVQGTLTAIPFNTTDFNVGSCYSTSTYRFTAPVSGSYYFRWNATSATTGWDTPTNAGNTVSTALYKNGTVIPATDNFLSLTNSAHRIPVGGSATIYLTAGDYVSAGIPVPGGQVGDGNGANSERLSFCGWLIG
jgi:hypothetical protein